MLADPLATLTSWCTGELVDLLVAEETAADLVAYANRLPSVRLSERAACDLELLATGGFSPLDRFMDKESYERVLDEMRLANGCLFPIPVTLPVEPDPSIHLDRDVALRDARNELLAIMTVEQIYEWKLAEVAHKVFKTEDPRHPLVSEMHRWGRINISGRLQVLRTPRHYDFSELRLTPAQVRAQLKSKGRQNVVAFQTRNPLHRAHEEMTTRAIEELDAILLLHPVVGMSKPGDIEHYTRVRTYKAIERYFPRDRILLALLPLAMRMAGPREALWHALIRRNYGATHMIVGRDHASPGRDSSGQGFYEAYEAQHLLENFSPELGVGVVPFSEMIYLSEEDRYEEVSRVSPQTKAVRISGAGLREEYLDKGKLPPESLMRPEVAAILAEAYRPRNRQGLCIWFTGLSCAGKSTTAEVLTKLFIEVGRQVTLLDGDVVRTNLSQGLGFTREDRDINIRRIGFVAAEIVRHGGVVICAAVSPYRTTRNDVRNMVGGERFVEVFVDTPVEVCESRDTKGMYAKARRGEIKDFTGVDDPYDRPTQPEIILDTVSRGADENARAILNYLSENSLI